MYDHLAGLPPRRTESYLNVGTVNASDQSAHDITASLPPDGRDSNRPGALAGRTSSLNETRSALKRNDLLGKVIPGNVNSAALPRHRDRRRDGDPPGRARRLSKASEFESEQARSPQGLSPSAALEGRAHPEFSTTTQYQVRPIFRSSTYAVITE